MRVSKAHRKCPGHRVGLFVLRTPYFTCRWMNRMVCAVYRHRGSCAERPWSAICGLKYALTSPLVPVKL